MTPHRPATLRLSQAVGDTARTIGGSGLTHLWLRHSASDPVRMPWGTGWSSEGHDQYHEQSQWRSEIDTWRQRAQREHRRRQAMIAIDQVGVPRASVHFPRASTLPISRARGHEPWSPTSHRPSPEVTPQWPSWLPASQAAAFDAAARRCPTGHAACVERTWELGSIVAVIRKICSSRGGAPGPGRSPGRERGALGAY